jgi:hypothetical protein
MHAVLSRLLAFVILLVVPCLAAEEAIVEKLKEGKSKEAAAGLQEVLEKDQSASPELFYNLGVAAATSDQPGKAFLEFDRALLLTPLFGEASQNIRALEKLGSRRFHFQNGIFEQIAASAKARSWQAATWWGVWAVVLAGLCLVLKVARLRWPFILLASLGAAWATACGVLGRARQQQVEPTAVSIVLAKEVSARTAPAETAAVVISLPPGSQVRPLHSVPEWVYAEIPAEQPTRGWISEKALAKLWPWEPSIVQ